MRGNHTALRVRLRLQPTPIMNNSLGGSYTPPSGGTTGQPIGLLLALTKAS